MKKLLFALPLLALAACGGHSSDADAADKDVLMHSDFDALAGWLPDATALSRGKAHSGQYSLFVDDTREFSPGFNTILGQLSPTRLRGIKLDAWAFVPNKDATAKLELVVKNADGKELLHDQTHLEEVSSYDKWVPLSKEIILPAEANYTSQLVIYMSRAGASSPVYVDDIKLTAVR